METLRIALFGATTLSGERLLREALGRGYRVTAITPFPARVPLHHPNLTIVRCDIFNKTAIVEKVKKHEIIISAYDVNTNPIEHFRYARVLIEAANTNHTRQLILMGHPGKDMDNTVPVPANAEAWKIVGIVQHKVLGLLNDKADFSWTYVYFPEIEESLDQFGNPVIGKEVLIASPDSEQRVLIRNCPAAVLDEAEHFTEMRIHL